MQPNLSSAARALAALALLAPFAASQTSLGGQPEGLLRPLGTNAPLVASSTPDVAKYLAEDAARNHRPLRYGALVDLAVGIEAGSWITLRDGSRVWRLEVASPGAKSLALEFDQFELPAGARLFVYDADQELVLGAYTSANRHDDGGFVFEPFPGERLTLEIDLPTGASDPVLHTKALIHDYRDVFGLMNGSVTVAGSGQQSLGACVVDVNCPEGANWGDQKRATMRTLSNGSLCSGALINNTALDGTRYVLTADHCGQGTSTVFTFLYQRPSCSSGSAPTNFTVSGCTILTSSPTYDCRLLRINPAIPLNYQAFWAGWTRTTQNSTFGFAMGHPSGGPKMISLDNNGAIGEQTLWRVAWNVGTLEGGSSGGPLFDQNGRVKGPACCVNDFVCSGQTAWFGRFDRFYTSNSLAQWLDPLGLNPTTVDGFDPAACAQPFSTCFTSPNSVGPGALVTMYGSRSESANDFHLLCTGLPPNGSGIFFYGQSEIFQAFGNGFRCVGNPVIRLPLLNAGPFGEVTFDLDLPSTQINAGETWLFQYWYRNPAAGGAGFNLSDAVGVPFCL